MTLPLAVEALTSWFCDVASSRSRGGGGVLVGVYWWVVPAATLSW